MESSGASSGQDGGQEIGKTPGWNTRGSGEWGAASTPGAVKISLKQTTPENKKLTAVGQAIQPLIVGQITYAPGHGARKPFRTEYKLGAVSLSALGAVYGHHCCIVARKFCLFCGVRGTFGSPTPKRRRSFQDSCRP